MPGPPLPPDEATRLQALRATGLLDSAPDERFDRITRLAARVLEAPSAAISLVDSEREWFKSRLNVDVSEIPRSDSFCGFTILGDEPLIVLDATTDPRFEGNPLVVGPEHLRFYAGCPLIVANQRIGTICVFDTQPRAEFSPASCQMLRDLASLASVEITHFRIQRLLGEQTDDLTRLLALSLSGQSPRDVSGFEAGVRRLAFLNRILLGLDAATDRQRAISTVLSALGEEGGWLAGLYWTCEDDVQWRAASTWKALRAEVDAFLQARSAAPETSPPSLVGRIWEQKGPLWIADLGQSEFPRDEGAAASSDLPSVVLYPVRSPARLEGILELRGKALGEPDDPEVLLASIACRHLGTHLAYFRENSALLVSESFLSDAQSVAHIGSWEYRGGEEEDVWSEEIYRLLGLDPGVKVHQSFETFAGFVHPDDRKSVADAFYASVRNGLPIDHEYRVIRKDGAVRHFHGRGALSADSGMPCRYIGTIQDVTDLKQALATIAEQAAEMRKREELDGLKRAFIDAISHDLRTPLTAVEGYAELLEDEVAGPLNERQRDYIERLRESTSRITGLVQDLLDYGRLEAGLFRLHIEPTDLVEIAQSSARSLEPAAARSAIAIRFEAPEQLVVEGDPRRLEQVFINLLSNAIKFSSKGGEVVIRIARREDQVHVEVEDRGPGIPPDQQSKLFKLYSQLPAGVERGGTGLGLFISKTVVEQHGGTIGVESQPGEGSRFWFEIPAAQGEKAEIS